MDSGKVVEGVLARNYVFNLLLNGSKLFFLSPNSASSIFEENYVKEESKHYNTFSNKVFGSWDMCVTDEKAAELKSMIIANEIEVPIN